MARTRKTPNDERYEVPAVVRTIAVIDTLVDSRAELTLSEICAQVGIPKSSGFLLLNTLESQGWVNRSAEGKYRLGLRLFRAGMAAHRENALVRYVRRHLTRLSQETGLTVHLAVLDRGQAVYVDKIEGKGFIQFATYLGQRLELHLSAVGKVLCAYLPDAEVAHLWEEFGPVGRVPHLSTLREFQHHLAEVRAAGYSLEDGEDVPGVRCVGAPIRDLTGAVVAAVSITALASDLPLEEVPHLGALVAAYAQNASLDLGYAPEQTTTP